MKLQKETLIAIAKIPPRTVAAQSMALGVAENEPLLVAFDAMLGFAKAYESQFGDKLETDYVATPAYGKVISGLRSLLQFDGAVAMERGITTTDSKDNGALEAVYWECCKAAGIDGDDL